MIVCPFVPGMLRANTSIALQLSGLEVEYVSLPASDNAAYGRLVRNLWAQGDTFVICEQDVVPTGAQLGEIVTCGHDWCSYRYTDGLGGNGPTFGLCRFDARVLREYPMAADHALTLGPRRDREAEWWHVDALIAADLRIRGVEWVQHLPPVEHYR